MEFISFNGELGLANLMFQRPFANIRIERTNKQGEKSFLKVNCVFAPRSRILKNLENPERKGTMRLPMITIERSGYSRNSHRVNNLHNEVKYEITAKNRNYNLLTPVPVDINYNVSIIAKYPEDLDKIASNFMVFFNNDIYVTCVHPKYEYVTMNNQIVMQDSVTETHPSELEGNADDFVTADFQFTFKTYLFGGTKKAMRNKTLSTYLSTITDTNIIELNPDEIDDFQKKYPDKVVSAALTTTKTVKLTSYVDSLSGDSYDDGIPKITKIDVGFYDIPTSADIEQHMLSVDSGTFGKHLHFYPQSYISSESYSYITSEVPGPEGKPIIQYDSLSTSGDFYDNVDNYCTLAPYVDRIYWEIDGAITGDSIGVIRKGCADYTMD